MKFATLILVTLIFPLTAFAGITEQGRGMLFGKDHAFFVSATSGWVLDNQSGVRQGLHMVFYPVGKTWADSPVIIYGRSVSKSEVPSIESQVSKTITEFHSKGSPNYKGEKNSTLKLANDGNAEIYYFSGDQWGNYEAVAYYEEKDTINFLVNNSRTKEEFENHLNGFRDIAKTYQNIYSTPSTIEKSAVNQLILDAKNQLKLQGGQEYETKAVQATGQQMATFMKDCTSYLSSDNMLPFHLFQLINKDGSISESIIYPSTSLSICFKGLMSDIKYPPHEFDSFLLDLSMSVTD